MPEPTWIFSSLSRIADSDPGGNRLWHVPAAAAGAAPTVTFTWLRPYGTSCTTSTAAPAHNAMWRARGRYASSPGQRARRRVPTVDPGAGGSTEQAGRAGLGIRDRDARHRPRELAQHVAIEVGEP